MCRHKMCSFALVCMFHKIWDITNIFYNGAKYVVKHYFFHIPDLIKSKMWCIVCVLHCVYSVAGGTEKSKNAFRMLRKDLLMP